MNSFLPVAYVGQQKQELGGGIRDAEANMAVSNCGCGSRDSHMLSEQTPRLLRRPRCGSQRASPQPRCPAWELWDGHWGDGEGVLR